MWNVCVTWLGVLSLVFFGGGWRGDAVGEVGVL